MCSGLLTSITRLQLQPGLKSTRPSDTTFVDLIVKEEASLVSLDQFYIRKAGNILSCSIKKFGHRSEV